MMQHVVTTNPKVMQFPSVKREQVDALPDQSNEQVQQPAVPASR
jgi:hypothetical protein